MFIYLYLFFVGGANVPAINDLLLDDFGVAFGDDVLVKSAFISEKFNN